MYDIIRIKLLIRINFLHHAIYKLSWNFKKQKRFTILTKICICEMLSLLQHKLT